MKKITKYQIGILAAGLSICCCFVYLSKLRGWHHPLLVVAAFTLIYATVLALSLKRSRRQPNFPWVIVLVSIALGVWYTSEFNSSVGVLGCAALSLPTSIWDSFFKNEINPEEALTSN